MLRFGIKNLKLGCLAVVNRLFRAGKLFRILVLRIKGVSVPYSSSVSWFAEISPMGGFIRIGENTTIDKHVILRAYGGVINMGDNCSVNPFSVLYGHGGLYIGSGVRIAAHSVFIPANHNFSNLDVYIYTQGETMKGIRVEDDVWFGTGVRVLDGAVVGKGVVVAAGAVVTKDLAPNCIYAGVPAKKIRER